MTNTTEKRIPAISANTLFGDNVAGDGLELVFANGGRIVIGVSELSEDVIRTATLHGLKQKLVDAAAISRNPETGRSATIDDKYAAVKAVFDRLLIGEWNATREGGTTGGLLLQALVRVYPAKSVDTLREFLAGKSDVEKNALRRNPRIASVIDAIRAESGKAASIDTDEILDELDGLE